MSPDEAAATVAATLVRLGIANTHLGSVGETIARGSSQDDVARDLPLLAFDEAAGTADSASGEYAFLSEIGRGGMGVIRLAEQRSLGRHVAVKTASVSDEQVRAALVREARILGALEHPNLVPVHALGVDEDGAPALVMKRIEGVSFRKLLDEPEHASWKPLLVGHGDKLRASVEILIAVCRALAFAHDRGVVHRDLKPDNVMIGRFGEVYLLDWGIAIRLSERKRAPHEIVGTPAYFAPEMVRADPMQLDARTDVFLLGATLFEILTGRPPNVSANLDGECRSPLQAALARALVGAPPELPTSAPVELVALVNRAMAREREERVPTAEAFREHLAHFLVSREADVIASDARASFFRARAAIDEEGPTSAQGFRALVEARFGFTTALRMRAADEAMQRELEEVNVASIDREIALRSPQGARALLADLTTPLPALEARIAALEADIARERAANEEVQRTQREADTSIAVRPLSRSLLVVWVVGMTVGSALGYEAWKGGSGFPVRQALAFDVFILLLAHSLAFVFRRRLFATAASRRLTLTWLVMYVFMVCSDAMSFALGHGTSEATVHTSVVAGAISVIATLTIARQLWPCGPVYLLGAIGALLAPRYAPFCVMSAVTLNVICFVRAFRSQSGKSPA